MNDKFLTQFQKEPDSDFAHKLWGRLQQVTPVTAVSATPIPHKRPLRLAVAFAILIFLFIAGLSPAVQAQIEVVLRQIGGETYKETAVYPGTADVETIIENETLNGEEAQLLEDARQRLGLNFNLPTALPERFTIIPEVIYGEVAGPSATFRWTDALSYYVIVLDVRHVNPDINWVVSPGSLEEVQINGHPAALVTGGWSADTQEWDDAEGVKELRWNQNGIAYSLTMFGNTLTQEEFVAIAESIE